jgi:alanine racemase
VFRELGYNPSYLHLANSAGVFDQPSAWGNMVRPGGVLFGLWRDVLAPSHDRYRTGSGGDWENLVRTGSDRVSHVVAESDQPAKGSSSLREDNTSTSINRAELPFALKPVMSLRTCITMLKWVPLGETIGYGCTYEASRQTLVATLPIGYNDGYMRGLSNRGRVIIRGTYASVIGRVSMDLTLVDVTNVSEVELGDVVTLMGQGTDGGRAVTPEDIARTAGTISYEVTCGISHRVPRIYLPK